MSLQSDKDWKDKNGSITPRILETRTYLATEIPLKNESHNPYSSFIPDNNFWFAYLPYIETVDKFAQWQRDNILITESHSELCTVHKTGNNFGTGKHLKSSFFPRLSISPHHKK